MESLLPDPQCSTKPIAIAYAEPIAVIGPAILLIHMATATLKKRLPHIWLSRSVKQRNFYLCLKRGGL